MPFVGVDKANNCQEDAKVEGGMSGAAYNWAGSIVSSSPHQVYTSFAGSKSRRLFEGLFNFKADRRRSTCCSVLLTNSFSLSEA